MKARNTWFGGTRIGLGAAAILMVALLVAPAATARAQDGASGPDLDRASWLSTAWSGLGDLWGAFWTPVGNTFSATTSDGTTTDDSTDDSTDTNGDGGLDPGGDGGFLDPDGAI